MPGAVQQKIAAIIVEIDRASHADVQRLTVLNKWFREPGRLSAFGLWVAERAAARGALSDGVRRNCSGRRTPC